ncbi:signal peptidase [Aequitasia blattaphilus]|uniref:Signal peptidase I n=1 Tax=Aequitasia blattaphilus TaxID=2949332 RepID=A0ABT1E5R3_9FIRM|nr:signal peptidase I [Aequitasia blattaphilus]MCP1100914.1 signal peptidase I [Aequitasia blattaphilus]MCR8613554.1 signal peptidase I [Aequitasia blattaphilus]
MKKTTMKHKFLTVIGTALCVLLIPILLINITLIIKSYTNPEEVPSVGGFVPMIVLTDSMYPQIHSGDLIVGKTIKAEDVKVEDVIIFFDPQSKDDAVVTHRVMEVKNENGKISFVTKGDANNANDDMAVPAKNLVGIYDWRIPGAGNIAMFMQTTQGLILCVICPLILLVGYDLLRRRKYEKEKRKDTEALKAELEALKAQNLKKKK